MAVLAGRLDPLPLASAVPRRGATSGAAGRAIGPARVWREHGRGWEVRACAEIRPVEQGVRMGRRGRLLIGAAVLAVALGVALVARAWFGGGLLEAAGDSVCAPRSGDQPLLVGAATVTNTRPLAVRVESVGIAGATGLELGDGVWAKRLGPEGGSTVAISSDPADLSEYTRVGADGLVVHRGERWSLVVDLVPSPGGGRLDTFDVVWSRGPFEYSSRTGPAVTVVPVDRACA